MFMDATWDNVRKQCAGFEILSVITQTIDIVKGGLDSAIEIQAPIRRHLSLNGDSGIANALGGFESPETVIFEGAKEVLDLTFEMLVQRIGSNFYDARDTSENGLYNWSNFHHNGSELEAIHIAILMFGDDDLRRDWSRVLSNAFQISRSNRS